MFGFGSQKYPPKSKFSYSTAQEYNDLVKKSVDHHRSRSRSGHRDAAMPMIKSPGKDRGEEGRPMRLL
jgi:hypothetical protein